jgi:hypothetical protein
VIAYSDEVRAARRGCGDMPLIVLSRAPFPRIHHETQAMRDARNYLWVELHDDVIDAVRQVVAAVRRGTGKQPVVSGRQDRDRTRAGR